MKRLPILSAVLAISLAMGTPAALGHAGHGDEFQAEGGINRVEVNTQTDSLLGIQVSPIESAPDGVSTVMIPVSALVEDNGRQLVFVQYENFYEPVPVTTGATEGERVEILEGLSVGEQLVTQGSLSLYAESRKTQPAEGIPEEAPPLTDETHAQADAEGIPHSHDAAGNLVQSSETSATAATNPESGGFPVKEMAIGAGVVVVVSGALSFLGGGRKKRRSYSSSSRRGGF
ncbi:MAG: hypothetical protein WBA43_21875 [Elainellaceae cyanobacterium]